MELKEQRYVVTLADTGNLTKAAAKLKISQPALSLYIKNLEKQFGELLFCRENRRITPTYFGETYIARAREILNIGEQFHQELEHIKNGSKGKVAFALPLRKSADLLPVILPLFRENFPDIEITVNETKDDSSLIALLDERKIDFAILDKPVSGFDHTQISEEQVLLAVSKNSPLLKEYGPDKPVDLKDLKIDTLLVHEAVDGNAAIHELLKNYFQSSASVVTLKSLDAIVGLIKNDFGASLVTDQTTKYMDPESVKIAFLPVKNGSSVRTLTALTRKEEELSPYAAKIIEMLASTPLVSQ